LKESPALSFNKFKGIGSSLQDLSFKEKNILLRIQGKGKDEDELKLYTCPSFRFPDIDSAQSLLPL
jgi:hypothetical protein